MKFFSEITNEVLAGVISSFIVGILAGRSHRIKNWLSSWNDEWSLRVNRNELIRMKNFKNDKNELTRFLLQQLLFGMTVAGASMLFLSMDIMGHAEIVALVRFVFGSIIYMLGIHAAATALRSKAPDKYIPSLEERIAALETRIEAKAVGKNKN